MPLTLDSPLSLYSIPVIYLTVLYPHNVKFMLLGKLGCYDNSYPRAPVHEKLAKKGVSQDVIDKVARLAGAHQNGHEIFPLWAAAVLAGNIAGVEQYTLNVVSGAFIGLRLLYNYIYITQTSPRVSRLRSVTWFTGMTLPMYLLVRAANKVRLGSTI